MYNENDSYREGIVISRAKIGKVLQYIMSPVLFENVLNYYVVFALLACLLFIVFGFYSYIQIVSFRKVNEFNEIHG